MVVAVFAKLICDSVIDDRAIPAHADASFSRSTESFTKPIFFVTVLLMWFPPFYDLFLVASLNMCPMLTKKPMFCMISLAQKKIPDANTLMRKQNIREQKVLLN